jgi:ankyrin repeat protein
VAEEIGNNITELMIAASRGDPAEIRRLIKAGGDINAADIFGNTALIYAALVGHAEIIEFLLRSGADAKIKNKRGQDCLAAAIERGRDQAVTILRGAELLLLIRDGDIKRATDLLDSGLDIDVQAIGSWTPLMVAALENQSEMVEFLLNRGAKVGVKNAQGLTAEMIAERKGHTGVVELLRSNQAPAPLPTQAIQAESNILDLDEVQPQETSVGDQSEVVN